MRVLHRLVAALGFGLAATGAGAADLDYAGHHRVVRQVVVERPVIVHEPAAMLHWADVVTVTPHHRYVVYKSAPAYLHPVYGHYPPVVVRVQRYFPRGVVYNRPSHLPPLKRCLC